MELTHVNRSTNRHADSLATLASKRKFEDDEAVIKINKRVAKKILYIYIYTVFVARIKNILIVV